jgi:amidohydrolase
MKIVPEIAALDSEMRSWRHHIHARPETAFEEVETSRFVAEKLESFGLEVHRGMAKTGVVGILRNGASTEAVGLRADLDALHVHEKSGVAHASTNVGKMHACGHDGHTTMLLGAAKAMAQRKDFDGIAYFIFQPAEESAGGGRVMVQEGLFDRFPMKAVYGLHNWPGISTGKIALRSGPLMAASDIFEIIATGHGAHAAMPHLGRDPMPFAAHVINALQTIVSRNIHPIESGVVSVTQVHGGDTWNVIPQEVVLRGTVRTYKPEVQDTIERRMGEIVAGIATTFAMTATLRYERHYPATVNSPAETQHALAAATALVGAGNVDSDPMPSMASEDFAFMLQAKPGCYIWLGSGRGPDTPNLHNPHYDFNDDALQIGASYWVTLAEQQLSRKASVRRAA